MRALYRFLALYGFALGLWLLAYQFPFSLTLPIGGNVELRRRDDEQPFFRCVNGNEPANRVDDPADPERQIWWWELLQRTGERPYCWTTPSSALHLPGVGGGMWMVELVARGGRPDRSPTPSSWQLGAGGTLAVELPAERARRFHLLVPADAAGDLRIELNTPRFPAPGDPRELGFIFYEARVQALRAAPRAPAWPQLGWLSLVVAVLFGGALASRAGARGASALTALGALAIALSLALSRSALTIFTPTLAGLAVSCAVLLALGLGSARLAGRERVWAPIVGLIVGAFGVRMAGALHPHALFSDLGFHANNLFQVTLGRLFFTAGLPGDVGGGQAPYPPGAYLLLLPGQLFAPMGDARRLLVQGGTALLDSATVGLIWLLLRRGGFGERAALFGAACYLLPTSALEAFSIGELANLGGQALVLPLLLLLAQGTGGQEGKRAGSWDFVALMVAVTLALLAHSGVTLSVGALVAVACAAAWWARLQGRAGAVNAGQLTLAAAAGLAVALLLFYSAPLFVATFTGRGERASVGNPPLKVLLDTLQALLGQAPPQDTRVLLPPLLGLAGLGGLILLTRRVSDAARPLRALLGAWWGGALLSLTLLVVAGQGVRWAIFLYPALCLGAGMALDWLWRRGRPGRVAAVAVLGVILAAGLYTWIVQIRDYIHV